MKNKSVWWAGKLKYMAKIIQCLNRNSMYKILQDEKSEIFFFFGKSKL